MPDLPLKAAANRKGAGEGGVSSCRGDGSLFQPGWGRAAPASSFRAGATARQRPGPRQGPVAPRWVTSVPRAGCRVPLLWDALQGQRLRFLLPLGSALLRKGLFPVLAPLLPLGIWRPVGTQPVLAHRSCPADFSAEFLRGVKRLGRNPTLLRVPQPCPLVPTWELHPASSQSPARSSLLKPASPRHGLGKPGPGNPFPWQLLRVVSA